MIDAAWPFWGVAYVVSARCYEGAGGRSRDWIASISIGAVCAHLGWLGIHFDRLPTPAFAGWPVGFTILGLPVGPAVVALLREGPARDRHLRAAVPSCVSLLAMARLGCAAAGCCAVRGPRPAAASLLEAGIWTLAFVWLRRAGSHSHDRRELRLLPGLVLLFGLLRAASESWRVTPPSGPPSLSPAVPAAVWIALGAVGWRRRIQRGSRRTFVPGSRSTSPRHGSSEPATAEDCHVEHHPSPKLALRGT